MKSEPKNPPISRRELEVARAYTRGKTYRQIANDLNIAPATVRTHINNIYRKLEVSSKIELLYRIEGREGRAQGTSRSWFLAPLLGLAAAASLASGFILPFAPAASDPTLGSVALVVFTHGNDETGQDLLARDLVEGFVQHTEVFVIDPTKASRALVPRDYARQLSADVDTRFVLYGNVSVKGAVWQVAAELFDRSEGAPIWSDRFQGAKHDSATIRHAILASLSQSVRFPDAGLNTNRCLELTEQLFQASHGAPYTKAYGFLPRSTRYCPSNAIGPQ